MSGSVTARQRDHWIPWIFVLGFGVLVLVDGLFVFLALESSTGLDTEQAYLQGLAHDRELAEARAQQGRGWDARLAVTPQGDAARVELRLRDAAGRTLSGAVATAHFRRPTQAALDFDLKLDEALPGQYAGAAALPARGQWEVEVQVEHADGAYRAAERVVLR